MKWYTKYLSVYDKPFASAPKQTINEVKKRIELLQNSEPLVTISVIAYNEEKHLPACLWSLSDMQCKYPVEIIGVDNDSNDKTAEVFRSIGIPYYTEKRHSCGFARSCGLSHAKGKYHINIDADTLYPPLYVETMINALRQKDIVAAVSYTHLTLPTTERV